MYCIKSKIEYERKEEEKRKKKKKYFSIKYTEIKLVI